MLHKYSFYVVVQKDGSTNIFLDEMKCQMCTTHLRGNRVVTRKSCFTLFIVTILAGKYFDIQVQFIIFCIFFFLFYIIIALCTSVCLELVYSTFYIFKI